ncbi:hypothetical protein [Streptomyces sp. NPDC051921]|uniref:hypothetical protein n=1 Tax=Streptomyces sp. NPDC051921 TaxID=3155806 RepID=UPI00342FBE3A
MSQYDTGGAELPRSHRRHASKRRGPGPLWMVGSGAVVVIGVLAAVAGLDSGPAGRSPAVDDGHPGMPALIQRDEGATDGASEEASGGGGDSGGPAPSTHPAGPSGSATAPTAPATTGTATPGGEPTATSEGQHPGRSGSAPGNQKKPR